MPRYIEVADMERVDNGTVVTENGDFYEIIGYHPDSGINFAIRSPRGKVTLGQREKQLFARLREMYGPRHHAGAQENPKPVLSYEEWFKALERAVARGDRVSAAALRMVMDQGHVAQPAPEKLAKSRKKASDNPYGCW